MRTLLSLCLVAAFGVGCAQMQKDLEKSANYGAGQAQSKIDGETGEATTPASTTTSTAAGS